MCLLVSGKWSISSIMVCLRSKINPLDVPARAPRDTRLDPNYLASHVSVMFDSQPNSQTSVERRQTSTRQNIHFRSPMCTAGLSCSLSSSPSDKEPSLILQSYCRFRQNVVERRVEQTPLAKAHLLVAPCILIQTYTGYLAPMSVLRWSICMGHIAEPFAVSMIHHVPYMSCVKAMKPAGQSSGLGISSLSKSSFPWHSSAVMN
jgi:hypothetical protein